MDVQPVPRSSTQTSVTKKIIMGISGLLLIGFLIIHLAGNLQLFIPDGGVAFNSYSHKLHGLQPFLNIARALLLIFFIFHIFTGIRVTVENRRARSHRYAVHRSKGGHSRLTTASRFMMHTGIVLLIFVPIHIWMFSLGPYYETVIDGQPVRDVYRLVVEKFNQPLIAFGYAATMLLLGLHLRHGLWSGLQSLGALNRKWSPIIYSVGFIFALLLAGGFLVLPLYIYFFVPHP